MELTQGMELAQVLKLSPGLLQSMEMLQMNTLELGAYLKELALENPGAGGGGAGQGQGQDTWEAFASQVPWLGDTPWTGQTAQEGDWGRGESPTESLRFCWRNSWPGGVCRPNCWRCAGIWRGCWTMTDGWTRRTWRGCGQQACRQSFWSGGWRFSSPWEPAGVGPGVWRECLLLQLQAAARGAYSGPSHLSGPFGGTEQGSTMGRWPGRLGVTQRR